MLEWLHIVRFQSLSFDPGVRFKLGYRTSLAWCLHRGVALKVSELAIYSSRFPSGIQPRESPKKPAMSYPDVGMVIYNEELGLGKSRKLVPVGEISHSSISFI